MVFLLAVLLSAVSFGMWPAIYASVLSFLAYNFFFIEPLYTFTIAEPYELLALVIFLIVAVITSALAGRVRQQAHDRRNAHAGDAPALRVHPPAVRPRHARRRGGGGGGRDPRKSGPRRQSCCSRRRRPASSRPLAAGGRARCRGHDGGALGLQPRRTAGADTGTLPTSRGTSCRCGSARKTLGVIGVARDKDGRRSIRGARIARHARRSRPPRRSNARRWRARW